MLGRGLPAVVIVALVAAACAGPGVTGEPRSTPETGSEPPVAAAVPETVEVAPRPVPAAPLEPDREPDALAPAEAALAVGDLEGAARSYELYLRTRPDGERRAEALLRLGLLVWTPETPIYDPVAAREVLGRLVREHPESPWRMVAERLLAVQGRIERLEAAATAQNERIVELEGRLEQLKRIDLEGEGRGARREPPDG